MLFKRLCGEALDPAALASGLTRMEPDLAEQVLQKIIRNIRELEKK